MSTNKYPAILKARVRCVLGTQHKIEELRDLILGQKKLYSDLSINQIGINQHELIGDVQYGSEEFGMIPGGHRSTLMNLLNSLAKKVSTGAVFQFIEFDRQRANLPAPQHRLLDQVHTRPRVRNSGPAKSLLQFD